MDLSDVPEGYPTLKSIDGRTWEERRKNYEAWTGKKVEPTTPPPDWEKHVEKYKCTSCEERQHDESL